VPAALLDATLDRITALDLLDGLVPILRKVLETASRIYQRLATIFDAAVIDGLRPASVNPPLDPQGHSSDHPACDQVAIRSISLSHADLDGELGPCA